LNRINTQITVPTVLVIEENGTKLGVMTTSQALQLAETNGKDLVEISSNSTPPVCKIVEYGKFAFEQKKAQKQPKTPELKEFRFGINIDDHDLQIKSAHIIELLNKNHPIKIVVRFRGREIGKMDPGYKLLEKLKLSITNGIFSAAKEEDKSITAMIRRK
jgi:translation initiation factor IF-3